MYTAARASARLHRTREWTRIAETFDREIVESTIVLLTYRNSVTCVTGTRYPYKICMVAIFSVINPGFSRLHRSHRSSNSNAGAEHRRAEFLLRPWFLADCPADCTFVGGHASVGGRTRGTRGGARHDGCLKPCQPPHAGGAPCRARITAPRVRCRGNVSRRWAMVARGVGGGGEGRIST